MRGTAHDLARALRWKGGEEELNMAPKITMLDLVSAVAEDAKSDAELIATVVYMVNSGRVRLNGNFRDCRFDLDQLAAGLAA